MNVRCLEMRGTTRGGIVPWVRLLLLAAVGCFGLRGAPADAVALTQPPGVNSVLLKLFGPIKAFEAISDVRIMDAQRAETLSLTMPIAMGNGRLRTELDMATLKSSQLPTNALPAMQSIGMDRIVSVVHPEKNRLLLIAPNLRSYAEMELPEEEAWVADRKLKVDRALQSQEIIDGRECAKHRVTISGPGGVRHQATVWNAADLRDFPVQIEVEDQGVTVQLRFRDIRLNAPDSKLFAAPDRFTRYADIQAMIASASMRLIQGSLPAPK